MDRNRLLDRQKLGHLKIRLRWALKIISIVVTISLLRSTVSLAQDPVIPEETLIKPTGTAESGISIWLPEGSVTEEFVARADYVAEQDLDGISYPPFTVGQAFTFGLWVGEGKTITRFTPSIVINIRYEDSSLDILPASRPDEERMHLMMYNPITQAWVKLCSSIDVHGNDVSAALSFPTPLDGKGSSLMALALDNSPPLAQTVDADGNTIMSLEEGSIGFEVSVNTVDVGTHFVITTLPNLSGSGGVTLFSKPIDIKGCRIDRDKPTQNNRELTVYSKPLKIGFKYDSDALSRAGNRSNLTIVNLQNSFWIDEEALGSRVVRGDDTITVETFNLGTFGMAAR